MAVPEQTPYKEYTANGVTTSFPLEFDCDNQDHLIVTVNDIEPENGQWSLINGAVVFLIAPANEAKIVIQRNTPLERNTNYQTTNNSFRPQPVNKDFDRIWWKLQEIWLQINKIWFGLKKEIKDRIDADLAIRSWVLILLNNIVDNGLLSAIAVTTVETVADLQNLEVWNGRTVITKSYRTPEIFAENYPYKGGAKYVYISNLSDVNDGFSNINGWVLIPENNTITPEQAGAYSDGINDDTIGCRKAIEYAYTIGLTVEFMSNATYIVNDKLLNIDESASTSVSNKSFTLKGNNCRIKLGGLAGDFIISVILPSVAQNNNKFTIQDFFFYTDNITRPSVFYFKNASWVSISNAVFFQTWVGVKFENGLRNDVNNCSFWGNYVGAHYHRTRDSAVSQTHAFSCEKGLVGTGNSNVATDGNLSLTDFTANACSEKGIELSGLYTPQLNNIIVEHCDIGIDYRSCQFGHLSNLFIGPCNRYSFFGDKQNQGLNNDYTQINNLNIQNEAVFRYMNFSQISNISAQSITSSLSGSVIYVTNSNELDIVNPRVRDSTIYNSILIEIDASDVNVLGGRVNNHITYTGNSCGSVLGTQVGGDVHFANGNMLSSVSYRKMIDGVMSKIDKLFVKYGTISGNSSQTFIASDFCKSSKTSAIITAGIEGSMTVAEIDFIKNNETIVGTIISSAGNRGSAIIEIVNSKSLSCAIKISATTANTINYSIEK